MALLRTNNNDDDSSYLHAVLIMLINENYMIINNSFDAVSGYYTLTCDRPCPQHCPSERCDRTYGHCICTEPGLFGPACDRPCPPFMFGVNCESHCRCQEDFSTGCDPRVRYICSVL